MKVSSSEYLSLAAVAGVAVRTVQVVHVFVRIVVDRISTYRQARTQGRMHPPTRPE